MIDGIHSKKQLSTAKPLVKGYNFYKSGNVASISFLRQNSKNYFKSQVLPSMRKDVVYQCYILMSSIGSVLRAYCGCPAGIDGRCNHAAATLFALEAYCKEREKQSDESCTSRPCKWNVPRKRKGSVVPIGAMSFKKHDYSKTAKLERKPLLKPGQDVRAIHQREWSSEKVNGMLTSIKAYQMNTGNTVGWSHILPQTVNKSGQEQVATAQSHPYEDKTDDMIISPLKELPPSIQNIEGQCERIRRKLQLDETEICEIAKQTKGQSNDKLWHYHRKFRITASKCHRIATLRPSTSPTKALREVLKYNKQYQSEQMKEGLQKEEEIAKLYERAMNSLGHEGLSVEKCGLIISQSHGFLAATPDGLVRDPVAPLPCGVLEMKYIQLNNTENLNQALLRKGICIKKGNNNIGINPKQTQVLLPDPTTDVCH